MERVIRFECEPRPFVIPKRFRCHREAFAPFEVSEYRRRSKVRPYGLRMEAIVRTKGEVHECRQAALNLAQDLNRVWAYVAGVPLFPQVLIARRINAPPGWQSNSDKISRGLPWTLGPHRIHIEGGGIRFGRPKPYLVTLTDMPLGPALAAVRKFRGADQVTRLLMGLHFGALNQPGTDSRLFLLAKALELVRATLPGRNDTQRQAALHPETRQELRRSLHWLYGIANNRLEVRHVTDRNRLQLLPRLTKVERDDFEHNADLVIRSVVAKQLDIELAIEKHA